MGNAPSHCRTLRSCRVANRGRCNFHGLCQ
ncbi:hypothetical protein LINGRAHAP2_LOCUS15114 [Linum grandiflorum]